MRQFLLILCALFLATNAEAGGKLKLHGQVPSSSGPALNQTAYWGPKTLVGNGGYDPCQPVNGPYTPGGLCTLPIISAPDTTNYYWEPTHLVIVPKNGASKTYNAVRSSALPASEVFTLTDSGGHTITVTNIADRTKAGDYTVRWRNGDTFNSTSGNAQLEIAFSKMLPGEDLRWRKNTPGINTTANTDSGLQGKSQFRFACNISGSQCVTANHTWFNGSNYITMQPEEGGIWNWGPSTIEGLYGIHFKNINFTGGDYTVCIQGSACATALGGVGSKNIWVENGTFIGNPNEDCLTFSSTCGKGTINGIVQDNAARNWKVSNSTFRYIYNAINLPQFPGTYPTDVNGTTPAVDANGDSYQITISDNVFQNVTADVIDVACMHHTTITNNLVYDRNKNIRVGGPSTSPQYINPFDAARQQHSDYSQNDCPGGVYEFWTGITITGNKFFRGITPPLTFWDTANGVPNPNTYVAVPAISLPGNGALVPDPVNAGVGAGQGLYWSNWASGHNFNGTSTPRPYDLVMQGSIIKDNIIFTDAVRGFSSGPLKDGELSGNVVIAAHDPQFPNMNDQSANWNEGKTAIVIEKSAQTSPVLGTQIVQRNISGSAIQCAGCTLGPNASNIGNNTLNLTFQAPDPPNGNPRSLADYLLGFKPILHGPAVVCTVSSVEVYAGPYRPDGSLETGTCP